MPQGVVGVLDRQRLPVRRRVPARPCRDRPRRGHAHSGATDQPSTAMWWMYEHQHGVLPGRRPPAEPGSASPAPRSKARRGLRRQHTPRRRLGASRPRPGHRHRRCPGRGLPDAARRPSVGNTVRRLSWRATTSASAARAPPRPGRRSRRTQIGHVVQALGPSKRSRNHRRRCARDSGMRSGPLARGTSAGRRRSSPPPRRRGASARPATVGASKTVRTSSSTPKTSRIRLTSRVASREWPPRSKKSSSMPTSPSAEHVGEQNAQLCFSRGRAGPRPVR